MRTNIETLKDLLQAEVSDIYSAETQITRILPSLIRNASTVELSRELTEDLAASEEHRGRLEEIARLTQSTTDGRNCLAMEGIVDECEDLLHNLQHALPEVRDTAIIGMVRKIEHYEIAAYESILGIAENLGRSDVAEIAMQTLAEERDSDRKLVELCEDKILPQCSSEEESRGNESGNVIEGEQDEYSSRPPHHRSAH